MDLAPDESSPPPVWSRSTELRGTSRITIADGQLGRFRQLALECVDVVRSEDSGTLEYDFFINAEGARAYVYERYRDSAAGLEHMRNISRLMVPLSEVSTMTGEVCGEPNDELRAALVAAGVTIYRPLTGRS